MENYQEVRSYTDMKNFIGKKVIVTGKVSDIPWQHIIGHYTGYNYDYYFDISDIQIVIYSKVEIKTKEEIRVLGTVVKVSSQSKKPGEDKEYFELHVTVDEVLKK